MLYVTDDIEFWKWDIAPFDIGQSICGSIHDGYNYSVQAKSKAYLQ